VALSPEEITAAEKVHASVCGFEKTRPYQAWGSAWSGVVMALSINARSIWQSHHRSALFVFAGVMVTAFLFLMLMRRIARSLYERDKLLLQVLERDHSAELPWIEEERQEARVKEHLAAVREIQREIARGHLA
jgi:hypothetical protein